MHLAHIFACGMGGIRTSGDLVAWMQLIKKMKITTAKKYVAQKLGIQLLDLTNEEVMRQLREDLGIGTITSVAGSPKGYPCQAQSGRVAGYKHQFGGIV